MQTIKLPYSASETDQVHIENLLKEYSPVIRSAYNRFLAKEKEKDIRNYLKQIYPNKDAWFLQSCIYEASGMATVDLNQNKKRIFGGKKSWLDYVNKRISKQEYRTNRLLPICSVGESPNKGNRKYKFDILNNRIIFKINKSTHVELKLPRLHKNYQRILFQLELMANSNKLPVTIKIDKNYIYISFEEKKFKVPGYTPIKTFHAGIDLNPNYIGFVIYNKNTLVYKKLYDLKNATVRSGKSSDDKKSIYLTNKLHHEILEISKDMADLCKKYKVNLLTYEDLTIPVKDQEKGRNFNRLVNNKWIRNLLIGNVIKRCNLIGIKCKPINPAYSSVYGNLVYNKLPDPLAAASEISRRGYSVYMQGSKSIYPTTIPNKNSISNQWKEDVDWSLILSWRDLFIWIKNSKVKYRVPIPDRNSFQKYKSFKSNIFIYI